jgi:hypothetical protein
LTCRSQHDSRWPATGWSFQHIHGSKPSLSAVGSRRIGKPHQQHSEGEACWRAKRCGNDNSGIGENLVKRLSVIACVFRKSRRVLRCCCVPISYPVPDNRSTEYRERERGCYAWRYQLRIYFVRRMRQTQPSGVAHPESLQGKNLATRPPGRRGGAPDVIRPPDPGAWAAGGATARGMAYVNERLQPTA